MEHAGVKKPYAGRGWNLLAELKDAQTFTPYFMQHQQKQIDALNIYFAGWPLKTASHMSLRDLNQIHGLSIESFVGLVTMVDDAIDEMTATCTIDTATALQEIVPRHKPASSSSGQVYNVPMHRMFQTMSDAFIREYGARSGAA